ncbi:progranulin isoform X3 [Alligator mississippiensis]|uniref:progranulin isoform X3 n=1 Tax=Alligator mississippiensis TaxID=8496 RepID=UPI0009071F14|nr:progranulin isoform X3 [Alligator mississippiensis]
MEPAGITFLLGLLVLWAQLPGAPGQDDGGKEGECPAGEVKAVPPSRVYCLSDRSCPGAEKCCSREHLRACLLPATVSPGYCPRSGPQEEGAGSCAASCSNDTACPGGQKCCVEGCCARCHCPEPAKPGVCPRKPASPDFAPCPSRCEDDRTCPGDEKCCFTGCGLGCVSPYKEKPEECPAVPTAQPKGPCLDACLDDSECPGDEKCCDTGCGHRCQAPHSGTEPPTHPLPSISHMASVPLQEPCLGRNPPGQVLGVGGRTGPSSGREPCPRGPSSTTFPAPPSPLRGPRRGVSWLPASRDAGWPSRVAAKPGACPLLLRGSLGPCMETCRSDGDCAGAEKCCSTSCGHICKLPVAVRPGLCPAPARKDEAEDCSLLCSQDSECPAGEKCCLLSCGRACVPPVVQEKPGRCRWTPHVCLGNVTAECHTDAECPGRRKCCLAGCARTCTPPETGPA